MQSAGILRAPSVPLSCQMPPTATPLFPRRASPPSSLSPSTPVFTCDPALFSQPERSMHEVGKRLRKVLEDGDLEAMEHMHGPGQAGCCTVM